MLAVLVARDRESLSLTANIKEMETTPGLMSGEGDALAAELTTTQTRPAPCTQALTKQPKEFNDPVVRYKAWKKTQESSGSAGRGERDDI